MLIIMADILMPNNSLSVDDVDVVAQDYSSLSVARLFSRGQLFRPVEPEHSHIRPSLALHLQTRLSPPLRSFPYQMPISGPERRRQTERVFSPAIQPENLHDDLLALLVGCARL